MSFRRGRLAAKYIFAEMLPGFTVGVLVFISILLVFQALRLTEVILMHNVGWKVIAKITGYLSISFLPAILPMSLLFSVLLTYGRLSADSEIVAFKASGLSLFHLLTPAAFLSAVVAVASAHTCFELAPWGNRQFEILITQLGNSKVVDTLREGTFSEGFFDLVVYANKIDSKRGILERVFIYDGRNESLPLTVIAQGGQLIKPDDDLNKATTLRLVNGNIHKSTSGAYTKIDFDTYDINLTLPTDNSVTEKSPQSLTLPEIRTLLAIPNLTGEKKWTLQTEFHKRIAIPTACFIFGLLGVGLGTVTNRRAARSSGLVLSIGIIIIYWGMYVTGENMARNGSAPAALSIWMPNAVFLIFSLWSLKRAYN